VSGEESAAQLKLRCERLGLSGEGLFVLPETNLEEAFRRADSLAPAVLVVDSIQTVYTEAAGQAPGSVAQRRQSAMELMRWVQALTSPTVTPAPRRTANGLDVNRLVLVSAVLSRRLGLPLASQDIIASVVGGLRVREPASDLALALAIVSSQRDKPIAGDIIALGEIGLSGELRSVSQLDRRLAEAERLGFTRAIVPASNANGGPRREGINVMPAPTVRDAVRLALP